MSAKHEPLRFRDYQEIWALLNVDMNSPPNPPILGGFEPQSPPELGDLGGVQDWGNPAVHTAIQQRRDLVFSNALSIGGSSRPIVRV